MFIGHRPNKRERTVNLNDLTVAELEEQVQNGMARIREVAAYKKGVKDTTQKVLKKLETATMSETAIRAIKEKSCNEEIYQIQTAKDRLRKEIDFLKKKLDSIRRSVVQEKGVADPMRADCQSERKEPAIVAEPAQGSILRMKGGISLSFLEDECNEKVGAALSPRRTSFPTRVVAPPPSPPTVGAKDTVLEKPTKEARAALSTSPTSAQWDAFLNAMLSKVEIDAKIDAKFEAIQERLLLKKSWRPPLSTTSNAKNAEKRVTTGTTNAKTKEVRVGKKSERRQSVCSRSCNRTSGSCKPGDLVRCGGEEGKAETGQKRHRGAKN